MLHATSRDESSGCFERTSVSLCSIRTGVDARRAIRFAGWCWEGTRHTQSASHVRRRRPGSPGFFYWLAGQGQEATRGKRQKAEEGADQLPLHVGINEMTARRAHASPGRLGRGKHETSVMRNPGPDPGQYSTGTRHSLLRSRAVAASGDITRETDVALPPQGAGTLGTHGSRSARGEERELNRTWGTERGKHVIGAFPLPMSFYLSSFLSSRYGFERTPSLFTIVICRLRRT
ncbi:hypothetical protein EDB87DRAFT_1580800 [Lactarius vividus]|nr:hypothetical protein EDB87DRAFT_1580800 [Lactarius vividus]